MSLIQTALACFLLLCSYFSICIGRHVAETFSSLAFGSCNKQYKPQPAWEQIAELNPQAWLWMGDAVYVASPYTVEQQLKGLQHQMRVPEYIEFLKRVPIVEGVWDDHDIGPNDCGKNVSRISERQDNYLDFLGADKSDSRRSQPSLHFTLSFGSPPSQVKIIVVDVRSQRDPYPIANFDRPWWKYVPAKHLFQVAARLMTGLLCLFSDYSGDVLGEEQWLWLEKELSNSSAAAHIIVSSVQVFSGSMITENWGFFPKARDRLTDLLSRTNPHGVVFLSGDIHLAQIIHSSCCDGNNSCSVLEITTSGLTHACTDNWPRWIANILKRSWKRLSSFLRKRGIIASTDHVTRNWGSVEMNWETDGGRESCERCENNERVCKGEAIFSIHDVDMGGETIPELNTRISTCDRWKELNGSPDCFSSPLKGKHCIHIRSFLWGLVWFLFIFILRNLRSYSRRAAAEYRQKKGYHVD